MNSTINRLNIDDAIEIASGKSIHFCTCDGGERWLDLSSFGWYDQSALNYLARIRSVAYADFGFHELTSEGATAIAKLPIDTVCSIRNLHALEERSAAILGDMGVIRDIHVQEPLSAAAALGLARGTRMRHDEELYCGGPLSISVPSITRDVASALSQHRHELYVNIRDGKLTAEIFAEFMQHAGYLLSVNVPGSVPVKLDDVLDINPAMRVKIEFHDGMTRIDLEIPFS